VTTAARNAALRWELPLRDHVRFALLNVIGGIAVLASYAWGVTAPGVGAALWGGVPEALRPLYTTNMFLAASGYFLFTGVVLRRLIRGAAPDFSRRMLRAYGAILFASALWLPLTAWMLSAPSLAVWALVRIDLFAVALGTLALAELVSSPSSGSRGERWIALAGLLPFSLQTIVLDAFVWPWFFDGPGATGGIAS